MEIKKTWLWAGATSLLAGVAYFTGRESASKPKGEPERLENPKRLEPERHEWPPFTLVLADAPGHLYTIGENSYMVFVDEAFVQVLREHALRYYKSHDDNRIHMKFAALAADLTLEVETNVTAPYQLGRLFRPLNGEHLDDLLVVGEPLVAAGKGELIRLRVVDF